MQERTTSAKIQVSQLEEKVCGLSTDILDNVKTTHMLRSQLGYAQHMKYDQCNSLKVEISDYLEALKQELIGESSAQQQFVESREKELKKLRSEKREILDETKLLESRISANEVELGIPQYEYIDEF